MADDLRARFLRDRVLTATPAQRVVMLYDRLAADVALAQGAGEDRYVSGGHLAHAVDVVAELQASLDTSAGGPAENLAAIYAYLINELIAARGGETENLPSIAGMVASLRDAWAQAAEQLTAASGAGLPRAAGAWVS